MNPQEVALPKTLHPALPGELRTVLVSAFLMALCLLVFVPGLANEFVWDDEQYISRNPAVAGGLSRENIRWALTTFHAGNWHPLTWLSHQLDVAVFGLNPVGHHLTSLLLHCANAVLTFLVFRRLTGASGGSALIAALFAVHPLHVESVAWAAERKDVLSTLLWLLALGTWVEWCRRPRPSRYLAAAALYALSLTAKQMPVTFPFLLLLLDWWPLGRLAPGRRMKAIAEKLPLVALAAAASAVAYHAQTGFGAVSSAPLGARFANAVMAYWTYIGKTLWPSRLSLLYPFPLEPPAFVPAALAAASLLAGSILVARVRGSLPFLPVGWFWFLGTLVPVIGIVQIGNQALADRYTYVPLTGLFVMATWGAGALAPGGSRRAPWLAAGALALVAALTAASIAQVRTWRDPVSAFSNAIRAKGDNQVAHYNLGLHHHEHGDDRLAAEHFRAAIAIYPDYGQARNNLALILEGEGRIAAAIDELRAATSSNPGLVESHYNLGRLLAGRGMTGEALAHFREAVRLSPGTALYRSDLGAALAESGRLDEAVRSFQEALRLDPGLLIARENLKRALSQRAGGGRR